MISPSNRCQIFTGGKMERRSGRRSPRLTVRDRDSAAAEIRSSGKYSSGPIIHQRPYGRPAGRHWLTREHQPAKQVSALLCVLLASANISVKKKQCSHRIECYAFNVPRSALHYPLFPRKHQLCCCAGENVTTTVLVVVVHWRRSMCHLQTLLNASVCVGS